MKTKKCGMAGKEAKGKHIASVQTGIEVVKLEGAAV